MKNLILITSIIGFALACSGKKYPTSEPTTLYKESMRINDEIMHRMDEMYRMKAKLKSLRDSLHTDSVSNEVKLQNVRQTLSSLEKADKGMMDWMDNFQHVPDVLPSRREHHAKHQKSASAATAEEIIETQRAQKIKIEEVKKRIESSIDSANAIITRYAY